MLALYKASWTFSQTNELKKQKAKDFNFTFSFSFYCYLGFGFYLSDLLRRRSPSEKNSPYVAGWQTTDTGNILRSIAFYDDFKDVLRTLRNI